MTGHPHRGERPTTEPYLPSVADPVLSRQTAVGASAPAAPPQSPTLRLPRHLPWAVAAVALLLVLAEIVTDLLPDDAVFSIVTPLRIVVGVGLLALLVDLGQASRETRRRSLDPWLALMALAVALVLGVTMMSTWFNYGDGSRSSQLGCLTPPW